MLCSLQSKTERVRSRLHADAMHYSFKYGTTQGLADQRLYHVSRV